MTDGSHKDVGSCSVFAPFARWGKFLTSLVFCLGYCFSTLVFLLQKKCMLRFDESDNEGMKDLLEATIIPPPTIAEHFPVAKESWVESSDRVEGARGALSIIEAN